MLIGEIDDPQPNSLVDPRFQVVRGWALSDPPISSVELRLNGQNAGRARIGTHRKDISAQFEVPEASLCGFESLIQPANWSKPGSTLLIEAGCNLLDSSHYVLPPLEVQVGTNSEVSSLSWTPGSFEKTSHAGINLAVFSHDLTLGGAQLRMLELLRKIQSKFDLSIHVVAPEDGPLAHELRLLNINIHFGGSFGYPSVATYEASVNELTQWALRNQIDVVWSNTLVSFIGVRVAHALGVPSLFFVHENLDLSTFWGHARRSGRLAPELLHEAEQTLELADIVLFASEIAKRRFEKYPHKGRLYRLANNIDLEKIETAMLSMTKDSARELLRVPKSQRLLLCAAPIVPNKGQATLLRAFALLAVKLPDVSCALVGDVGHDYADGMREFSRRSGLAHRIRMVPHSAVEPWYRAADICVCSSDDESLPTSVLEAMGYEVPIVATSVGGVPEIVEHRTTGLLCEPNDVCDMADVLELVLSLSPRTLESLTRAAKDRVRRFHSLEEASSRLGSIIADLVQHSTENLSEAPRGLEKRDRFELLLTDFERSRRILSNSRTALIRTLAAERKTLNKARDETQKAFQDLLEIQSTKAWEIAQDIWHLRQRSASLLKRWAAIRDPHESSQEAEEPGNLNDTDPEAGSTSLPEASISAVIMLRNVTDQSWAEILISDLSAQTLAGLDILIWCTLNESAADLAADLKRKFPGIRVFSELGQSPADALNAAIKLSKGEFVSFFYGPTRLCPTYYEKVQLALSSSSVSAVYPWVMVDGSLWRTTPLSPFVVREWNQVPAGAVFRRDLVESAGRFQELFGTTFMWWEFWAASGESGASARVLSEPLLEAPSSPSDFEFGSSQHASLSNVILEWHKDLTLFKHHPKEMAEPRKISRPISARSIQFPKTELRPVLLTIPWMTHGGGDRVVEWLIRHWREHGRTVIAITTAKLESGMEDRWSYVMSLTPFFYRLPDLLAEDDWVAFFETLGKSLEGPVLLNIGSSWAYGAFARLKQTIPNLRVVDQQFNAVGHLQSNRSSKGSIDLTIASYGDLSNVLLQDGRSGDSVRVIRVGIEPLQRPTADRIKELKARYRLPLDLPILSFVGRFSSEKRPEWAVDLATHLARHEEDVFVVMAGDGPAADALQDNIAKASNVIWLGNVEHGAEVIAASDMLIVPSTIEGIPQTAMEAVMMGKQVVGTRVGGMPELERLGGVKLCSPDDFHGFVEAVREALRHPETPSTNLPDWINKEPMLAAYDEVINIV